jgi:integrase
MSIRRRRTAKGFRYDVRLRDPAGYEYSHTFVTLREARAFEDNERAVKARGGWIDPRRASTSFDEWATHWLDSDPAKRPRTRATDAGIISRHLSPTLGRRPLGSITPRDVQGLVSKWSQVLAPRSVRRLYAVLRAILNAAVASDLIARSPRRGIKLPQVEAARARAIDPHELALLAHEVGRDYQALVYLGAVLGLRWGEAAALRVGCIDVLRTTLAVSEAMSETKGVVSFGPPKSAAGGRTMSIPGQLAEMIALHLARHGLTGADPDALVFTAPAGGPLRYSNFRRRVWLPATQRAALPGLGFHDLRRSSATAMVAMGIDLRTAQTRLGHSDPRLTLGIYAQATDAGDRSAAEHLGRHFMSDTPGAMTTSDGIPATS